MFDVKENKTNVFAKYKFYGDIDNEEYLERLKYIERNNEVLIFYDSINEIVRFLLSFILL